MEFDPPANISDRNATVVGFEGKIRTPRNKNLVADMPLVSLRGSGPRRIFSPPVFILSACQLVRLILSRGSRLDLRSHRTSFRSPPSRHPPFFRASTVIVPPAATVCSYLAMSHQRSPSQSSRQVMDPRVLSAQTRVRSSELSAAAMKNSRLIQDS